MMLRTDEMSDFHLNKDCFGKLRVFKGAKKIKGDSLKRLLAQI